MKNKNSMFSLPAIVSACFALLMALAANIAWSGSAEMTRFVHDYTRDGKAPNSQMDKFFANEGQATLVLTDLANSRSKEIASASVMLNGEVLLSPSDFRKKRSAQEIPITLREGDNEITVRLAGKPGTSFQLRVKQFASTNVNFLSRVHFNTNVSNFRDARKFYQDLGLVVGIDFPQSNTLAVAEAIGIEGDTGFRAADWEERLAEDVANGFAIGEDGGYLLKGQLITLPNFSGNFIDLIEFTIPRKTDAPYPTINHLGMAMAAFETADIDYDYHYMTSLGIEFLSEPTINADGETFAIFKDLDGVFYQLLETDSLPVDFDGDGASDLNTNINKVGKVTINVSDLERSVAYYTLLGFTEVRDVYSDGSNDVADALGMPAGFSRLGKLMALPDGSQIELIQWLKPFNEERPYELPVNHIGIHRIAFAIPNITTAVTELEALGIEFLSPIAPCCAGEASTDGIVGFLDPDGTVLEFFGAL